MVVVVTLILIHALSGPPTSLGEVALREALRRQSLPASVESFTNESLGPVPDRAPAEAETTPPPTGAEAQAGASTTEEVKDETWWRERITTAREAVARDEVLRDALQTRVSALANDIASRDDPAQRAQLMATRQQALAELDRIVKQIAAGVKAIADIEEEARKLGVPPGWLR
jgi:hypothetical protein